MSENEEMKIAPYISIYNSPKCSGNKFGRAGRGRGDGGYEVSRFPAAK